MWEYVDNKLIEFNKKYLKENQKTLDEIQNLMDRTKDINKYATKTELERFKRLINNNYEYLSNYGKYQANKYLKRAKIRNDDLFWFSLYIIYALQQFRITLIETEMMKDVANDVYNNEIKELSKFFEIKKKLETDLLVDKYLKEANSKGYIWQDYNDAITEYNTTELFNQVIHNIRANKPLDITAPEFQKIINKQNKRLISINGDKISGAMDNEMIYIANEIKKETYIFAGVDKCKFIAIRDKKTTDMCESLDGQIFNVHDWNEFYRYSASNEAKIKYNIYGLVPGINLPPIDDHFHHCRSTITYQLDEAVEKDIRSKLAKGDNND